MYLSKWGRYLGAGIASATSMVAINFVFCYLTNVRLGRLAVKTVDDFHVCVDPIKDGYYLSKIELKTDTLLQFIYSNIWHTKAFKIAKWQVSDVTLKRVFSFPEYDTVYVSNGFYLQKVGLKEVGFFFPVRKIELFAVSWQGTFGVNHLQWFSKVIYRQDCNDESSQNKNESIK
jgi:hypothetical protein